MPPSPRTTKLVRIFVLCEEELYMVKAKTCPSLNLAITCFTAIQYCLFFLAIVARKNSYLTELCAANSEKGEKD